MSPPPLSRRTGLPELLAPAGSPGALRAAVAAGADAVYLSGKRFGARKSAANFSDTEILDGIRLAHAHGVRVYVTVNTLVHDRELRRVAEYLAGLYAAGADAVLVQDIGVAALAREIVPDLAIHASTQMTIHSAAGVLWAAEQGFSRVVLSRELPLAEIRAIAEKTRTTGIGLEVFAHGALCYSYSGQCLLSSAIGGRSGNRGMCAQPCRKPYALVAGDRDAYGRPVHLRDMPAAGPYLLSPKDLCTYRHLPELAGAPLVSLKIEGRMRSPEYVAIVVSTYRRALDAIAAGSWKAAPEAERDLLLAFNRGFTGGYLFGDRQGDLMARDAPDNRGICIGTVTGQDWRSGEVTVQLNGALVPAAGDGLLFVAPLPERQGWGFSLNNTPVARDPGKITFTVPRTVPAGSSVSITSSRDLDARARQILAHPPPGLVRKVPVDLRVRVGTDGRVTFDAVLTPGSGKEVRVSYQPDFCLVPARSRPLTRGQVETQLRKSGDAPLVIRDLSLDYAGDRFAPVAELNRMRREFLARAEEALVASFLPTEEAIARAGERLAAAFPEDPAAATGTAGPDLPAIPLAITVYTDTPETAAPALREGCSCICFEPAPRLPPHTTPGQEGPGFGDQVTAAMALCRKAGARFVLKLPRITRDAYLGAVLPAITTLYAAGLTECMVGNPGTARAIRTLLPGLAITGAAGLNIFNHRSACHLSSLIRSFTLSPELSRDECRALVAAARRKGCPAPFAFLVQGTGEVMIAEDCLPAAARHGGAAGTAPAAGTFYGIRDTTGRVFPVRIDGEYRTTVGNAVETCLIDHLPELARAGIGEIVIDARGRTGAYAGEMTRVYREAAAYIGRGAKEGDPRFALLKERARAISLGGITAGLFLRGLKE